MMALVAVAVPVAIVSAATGETNDTEQSAFREAVKFGFT